MRKIISSTYATLDGFIDNPHLWSMQYVDEAARAFALPSGTAAHSYRPKSVGAT